MKTEHKEKLEDKLKKLLGREPTESEKINAEKDAILCIELCQDRLDKLEEKVIKLEKFLVI